MPAAVSCNTNVCPIGDVVNVEPSELELSTLIRIESRVIFPTAIVA